jgi:pimeloyl-ACP methyl ester carboxylesterase
MHIPRRSPSSAALRFACAFACATLWTLVVQMPATEAHQSSLAWTPCGGTFQCARLEVPLDYANPQARSIELALVRQPARDPSRRIGALLINPGGPGGSGVEITRFLAVALAGEVQARFDIVGFDPRGVGGSTPLLCHDNIQRLGGLEPEPDSADEWAEVIRLTRGFTELCAARGADMLPHLGSVNVARDMDRIREALGDEQISYLGYSYGTVLGALYADRFPTRLRAAVLDGAVDIGQPAEELIGAQAAGFERTFNRFVENRELPPAPLRAWRRPGARGRRAAGTSARPADSGRERRPASGPGRGGARHRAGAVPPAGLAAA